jgi:PEP-CTERM motif
MRGGSILMQITQIATLGALAALGLSVATAPQAQAAYVAYLYQSGSNVVATGSGSIDLDGLSVWGPLGPLGAAILPGWGIFAIGNSSNCCVSYEIEGGQGFGLSQRGFVFEDATTASGNSVGVSAVGTSVTVPEGYVSGTALGISTATWDNTTLAALLGLFFGDPTPYTATWIWGSGADADSFTLHVGVAPPSLSAPEPASLALLGTGLVALVALVATRRRQKAQ